MKNGALPPACSACRGRFNSAAPVASPPAAGSVAAAEAARGAGGADLRVARVVPHALGAPRLFGSKTQITVKRVGDNALHHDACVFFR